MNIQLTVNALFDGVLAILSFRDDFIEEGVAMLDQLLQVVAADVGLEQPLPKLSQSINLFVGYFADSFLNLHSVKKG